MSTASSTDACDRRRTTVARPPGSGDERPQVCNTSTCWLYTMVPGAPRPPAPVPGTMPPMAFRASENRYDDMQYRRTGRSGLDLPAVSLGLWHNFGDDVPFDRQRDILRRAFDLGVTHFDLANNYGPPYGAAEVNFRSEEHTSELQSHVNLVCRLLLEKKKTSHHRRAAAYGVVAVADR